MLSFHFHWKFVFNTSLSAFKKLIVTKDIKSFCSSFPSVLRNKMDKQLLFQSHGINEESFKNLIEQAKDYAVYKGIAMHNPSFPKDARIHLPFCVIPSQFSKKWYEYVYELQPHINYILHKISYSKDILKECLSSTMEADEFTRNVFNIFENVCDEQSQQPSLGFLRSDYLLNCDTDGTIKSIKQVENNTIAAGFCGIGPALRELYVFISKRLGWKDFASKLPANECSVEMATGMISAWKLYNNQSAIIVFLVEETTFNICDQRALEFKILELNSEVEVMRCTFKQLRNSLSVRGNKLYVNDKEVAVVYYRVGYSPEHYEKQDWDTRLRIEQSQAIKCPSVGLHLAGTKKVQLYLAQEGVLEQFVSSDVAQKLREVFANQYVLDSESDGIIGKVLNNPEKFVLKAEREGGGNNLYGHNIENFIKSVKPNERKSYILMDRIYPPGVMNCIVRANALPEYCHVTSELGIYGVILGNKDFIDRNVSAGHLLRSKSNCLDEGGVAAGYGSLDYPYLS